MASSLNKSSSLAASSIPNSNARNSEISNPMRRSFSGNPFAKPSVITNSRSFNPNTPANSPSDFPRRNSVGSKESVWPFRDLDDKENEKDQNLKSAKVGSPAVSKSHKNFMSPTISASFKITVSPRKKALTERNELARTSVSSVDGKSPIRKVTFAEPLECDFKPDVGVEEKVEALSCTEEIHTASLISGDFKSEAVPSNANNETESSFETFAEEPDCVNLDPTFKLSPTPPPVSSTSTILAPLDADPFMPPYDPESNYLSPRPQFLHFKPNPRIKLYKERDDIKLEESFASGSFSETQVTEDTHSEGSQKEPEEVSSDETVKEEENHVPESSHTRTLTLEEIASSEMPKSRFFMRTKAIALLLLLSVAFISISVTNSPVIDHTVFKELTIFSEVFESSEFSEFAKASLHNFSEIARANFDGLAGNLHIWFSKSLSSISEFISNLRGVQKLAHVQYCNLTDLHEFIAVDHYLIYSHREKAIEYTPEVDPPVLNFEEDDTATESDTYEDIGDISVENYDIAYEEQAQQDVEVITGVGNASESEEVLEGQPATLIESEQTLQLAEVSESKHLESEVDIKDQPGLNSETAEIYVELFEGASLKAKEAQQNDASANVENQPGLDSEAAEFHIEVFEADNLEANRPQEKNANVNVERHSNLGLKDQPELDSEIAEIHTEVYDDETDELQLTKAEGLFRIVDAVVLPSHMLLSLLVCGSTVVIAVTAFNWSRKGKSRSSRVTSSVEQPLSAKTLHANYLDSPKEQISLDRPSLRNGPTEIDVLGESRPSEMSSFQKSSYYSRKVVEGLNEASSLEKKPKKHYRRESLTSSSDCSTGSPSYGSFTTYEKIPTKHGLGDGESITPVRRSSRIRNQATSPR